MRRALALKIARSIEGGPCSVCGTYTFLTPCCGDHDHDPDGLRLGQLWARLARWVMS